MYKFWSRLGSLSIASVFSLPMLLTSVVVSAVVIGGQKLGVLEAAELSMFDQLVRLKPDSAPDPRLLIVTVTEEDIQKLGKWPIDDRTLDRVFERLEQYQPRVIGLDIYRDIPIEPGHAELTTRLQLEEKIVAVCKVGDASPGIAPPPVVPENRLGFSDVVVDAKGVVRRSLLVQTPEPTSKCRANQSFSLQLALMYLEKEGIQPQLTQENNLQLGATVFKPLPENIVGYRNLDAKGYQILLNYRSRTNLAQQVTLSDVLANRVDPSWVRDRLVLIGVTASSINDYFYTPYSQGQQQDLRMAGVMLHAQMTSQILSAVLDGRSLFWFLPGVVEVLWLWVWSLAGGVLAWRLRHPLLLGIAAVIALGGLYGICYVVLTQAGWIPLMPPALAFAATIASAIYYKAYQVTQPPETNLIPPASSGGRHASMPTAGVEVTNTTTALPPDQDRNPLLGGRYKIIEPLGSGGFGQTYLAADMDRPGKPDCVVKQLLPNRTEQRFLQVARRLFNAEAETLEKLGKHDQIPQLLAYFEQDREFYLVQEFIRGHSLDEELPLGQQLPKSEIVAMLKDLLAVLDFVHAHGAIHRDVKPTNIIRREPDGKLVLIDFGAVQQLQSQIVDGQASHTIAIGTPGYAAPEQLLGQPVYSSDIYALGVIGIQAATGKAVNQLPKDLLTHEPLDWRQEAQISDDLADILDKMVRYRPCERYQSAAEVLKALQSLSTSKH